MIEWDLESVASLPDVSNFFRGAVAAKRWAFAADWARFAVLKEQGGIYLDLDVELVQPIEKLPTGEWVAGEWLPNGAVSMNPGSGIALEQNSPIARAMLDHYAKAEFGDKQTVGEVLRNLDIWRRGASINVLPPEVMSPIDNAGKMHRTERTVGIHWYAMSWASPKQRILQWLSWHGMRPLVDLLVTAKHVVRRRRT